MRRATKRGMLLAAAVAGVWAAPAPGLVYCVTNAVDEHRSAPAGDLAGSGWDETVPVDLFLATAIHSNALLTAKHIWEIAVGETFSVSGQTHTVTAKVEDAASDLAVLLVTPPLPTPVARLNIETDETQAFVVLQGRGMERGETVVTGGRTNGWRWAWNQWLGIRRWGTNRYTGESADGLCAVAAFDGGGDPHECMLSVGDSGGPGFIRTGGGWKLATINYSVDPAVFTASTNPAAAFHASLFDCAGLFYDDGGQWRYVPAEASPRPCVMLNTRVAKRVAWLTNVVQGITFPADVGVSWRCERARPRAGEAAAGLWFEVTVTNAGPYRAREVAVDVAWAAGLRVTGVAPSQGAFASNRWTLAALDDGASATLRAEAVAWRSAAGWGTNRASVAASDKPDAVASNDQAACAVWLPETATRLRVE